jgi:hypothetical protein
MMKDHPDVVRELDGFREFLHNHIRRARKADQQLINPVKDDDSEIDDEEVDVSDEEADELLGSDEEPATIRHAPESEDEPMTVRRGSLDDEEPMTLKRSHAVHDEDEPMTLRRSVPPEDEEPMTLKRTPAAPPPVAAARGGNKASYKIYPGGRRYGGKPVVTRYKGKVYGPSGATQFKPNEQGVVGVDNGKLTVKKPDSDHTQTWDPVDEAARPVLYLNSTLRKRTR